MRVVGYIERGLHYREHTLAAFLDIETFNNIGIEAIRKALKLNFYDYQYNYQLKNIGEDYLRSIVTRATPQVGLLSSFLWLLAGNIILCQFLV